MKKVREGKLDPPSRKAFFFSAHELNVVALSRTLGLEDPAVPSYGSTFILETLQDENNEYFVRVRENMQYLKNFFKSINSIFDIYLKSLTIGIEKVCKIFIKRFFCTHNFFKKGYKK